MPPVDVANGGYGVLIAYDLLGSAAATQGGTKDRAASSVALPPPLSLRQCEGMVSEAVDGVLAANGTPDARSAERKGMGFLDLGLDSFDGLSLSNALSDQLGGCILLGQTLIFEHASVRALAAYLHEQIQHVRGNEAAPATLPSPVSRHEGGAIALAAMRALLPGTACTSRRPAARFLFSAGDCGGLVPQSRWEVAADAASAAVHGAFAGGIERFDAPIFGVSALEAAAMDPQQRLLLEGGYGAWHGAGRRRVAIEGAGHGIFLGIMSADYGLLQVTRACSIACISRDLTLTARMHCCRRQEGKALPACTLRRDPQCLWRRDDSRTRRTAISRISPACKGR